MSINPFSSNEIKTLKEFIEKNGWKIEKHIENYFRYSIKKNKIILFTFKYPISLPLRINIPFEVVSFQVSLAFQFWNLNKYMYTNILYFMKSLRKLALNLTLEHTFSLDGKKEQLNNLLNFIIPESIRNENESSWLNRIRISLMNKENKFKEFSNQELKVIEKTLQNLGLKPTFKIPWELKFGIPKIRTSETIFFSDDKNQGEFFILEKGYFTYINNIEHKKFYLRGLIDSYSPYILKELFSTIPEFKLELLLENWIKFTRLILDSVIEIIEARNINKTALIRFRPDKQLIYNNQDFVEDKNNYPFSALSYESSISKELFPIHNDLFNKPPSNFEVIESINQYTEAEELINNYRFEEATKLLNESLIVFNKNQQKKIIVSILLKLSRIAKLLNHEDTTLNYLQNALGVAKSGEIPIDFIIKIHYKLGVIYYKRKEIENALNHFKVIINFLENEKTSFDKVEILGLAYIYIGLIVREQEKVEESRNYFKDAFQIGNKNLKVKLTYCLLRAIYYKKNGNLTLTQKFLKAGLDTIDINFEDKQILKRLIDLNLEMAEFYIHYRKDIKRAYSLLKNIENLITLKEINNMKRAIRWNLLMSDLYNTSSENREKSQFYLNQSQKLKTQLHTIGVSE
ncbi:MAG: hypothetical protein ACFFC3_08505 [Candidatus Odinarchaeota archaeon]